MKRGKGKGDEGERECHAYQRRSELNGNGIQAKGTGRDYHRDPINTVHIHLHPFHPLGRFLRFGFLFAQTWTDLTHVLRCRDRLLRCAFK